MTFSTEWDQRYKEDTHMSVWPWSDLVSLVMRTTAGQERRGMRVLELGCGAGANIPFFLSQGFDYYAIDGSETIVAMLINKYPHLKDKITVSDFTEYIPFDVQFDLIVDRAALTHNSTNAIIKTINLVNNHLKERGAYIGIDWFSSKHSEYNNGFFADDLNTKTGFVEGPFSKVGKVHFSNQEHVEEVFSGFTIELLEEKVIQRYKPLTDYKLAYWNIIAIK